ncbi:MAG: hypothetical protein R2932_36405 [Caldilineaceae bacterium]
MQHETAFTMDTSSIKYGPGVTREIGSDMANLGCKRVMVVTDPRRQAGAGRRCAGSLARRRH